MLWRENLSFEALALLGEGVYKDLVVTLYGGENGIYDQKPFEEGLRLSPDSYLFLNDLGWVLYRQNKYTEAKELFQSALRINPDGVDFADGIVAERGSAEIAKDDAKPETESSGEPIFQTDASAPYAHPYFWAPFILFGNWR
jgi:tetratricopeptide (TPR) repeat protein